MNDELGCGVCFEQAYAAAVCRHAQCTWRKQLLSCDICRNAMQWQTDKLQHPDTINGQKRQTGRQLHNHANKYK